MEYERGNSHRREDHTYVDPRIQQRKRFSGSGTGRQTFKLAELSNGLRICRRTRRNSVDHCSSTPKPRTLQRCSSEGASDTLSDNPWPRLSKVTTRAKFERRRKNAVYPGSSCMNSMCDMKPGTIMMSTGPSPIV